MTEKEQLAWCAKNRAAIWFSQKGIRVKDFNVLCGKTLEEASWSIEKERAERRMRSSLIPQLRNEGGKQ